MGVASIANRLLNNGIVFKIMYWLACILVYAGIIYLVVTYNKKTPSIRFNDNIIYTSLFFIFFISKLIGSVPLLIDDFLRLLRYIFSFLNSSSLTHDVSRLDFLKKSALFLSGTLFSTLLIGIKLGRYNFKKNYQSIFINNWPSSLENYKIVHISDLHLGSFNNVQELENVVEIINEEQADIVVFTGDLVNNYYHEAIPYLETLKKITAKNGKFSILGNHDYCDYVMLKRDSK